MQITLLGTGTPEPSPHRASSGHLVEIGDDVILMDCGGGVFDRLVQSGRRPEEVTHLFFTHLHSDHMMDYARLVHAAWDAGGDALRVFGPRPLADITGKLFGEEGVFAADLTARTELQGSEDAWVARGGVLPRPWPTPMVTEIEPGFAFSGDGWQLRSCSVPHVQPYLTSLAFRLEAGKTAFVYTGDAGLCPELEDLAAGADLLLHWCFRLSCETDNPFLTQLSPSPVELASMAKRIGVKRLVLTHLRPAMDQRRSVIEDELRRHFGEQAVIGDDLMTFTLEG